MYRFDRGVEAKESLNSEYVSVKDDYLHGVFTLFVFILLCAREVVHRHNTEIHKDLPTDSREVDIVDICGPHPALVVVVTLETLS